MTRNNLADKNNSRFKSLLNNQPEENNYPLFSSFLFSLFFFFLYIFSTQIAFTCFLIRQILFSDLFLPPNFPRKNPLTCLQHTRTHTSVCSQTHEAKIRLKNRQVFLISLGFKFRLILYARFILFISILLCNWFFYFS